MARRAVTKQYGSDIMIERDCGGGGRKSRAMSRESQERKRCEKWKEKAEGAKQLHGRPGMKQPTAGAGDHDVARNRLATDGRLERIDEVMGRGCVARTGELNVPIVDAAVVKKLPARGKDGHFRSDGNLTQSSKSKIGIAKRRETIAVIEKMLTDELGGLRLNRINQEESGVAGVMGA
jgi:hypothetical protein